ncbi:MAG TPA: hypothetical protein VFM06_11825 [Candidatus Limnocylindria bacterium]|nr:hypothetical protein [Candidatus Limnocylindria bacterium]
MTLIGATCAAIAVASLALLPLATGTALRGGRHPDASALALVAPAWSAARWEGLRAAGAAGAVAAFWGFGLWPLVLIALIALVAPSVAIRWRAATLRSAAAARSLDILQGTHAALRSGVPLTGAVRLALDGIAPLAREPFERALRAFDLNLPLDEAFRAASREAGDRRVTLALDALAVVAREQLPAARAATIVAGVCDRLAFEQRLLDEVRSRTSGVRAQIVLLAFLVPALAAYLVATMPGLAATLASPLGLYVLAPVALLFEVAGLVASRQVIRSIW